MGRKRAVPNRALRRVGDLLLPHPRLERLREAFERARQRLSSGDAPALVLADASWHAGVIGIVAARVAETTPPGPAAGFESLEAVRAINAALLREALARDVWVIACSEGGVGEAIVDGDNGELIPMTSDPDFLREAIFRCLQQPDRIRAHQNPHKAQLRYFDQQAHELHEFYLELL